jgi:heme-degrading monooxygenase HmoA
MLVQIVRYRTGLSDEEVQATLESRAADYEGVPGLVQKYYLSFAERGAHGGVYLWASREAFEAFRASDLARTIATAYRVRGAPQTELADVSKVLHPRCATA